MLGWRDWLVLPHGKLQQLDVVEELNDGRQKKKHELGGIEDWRGITE